jgi:hypothetical protein
MPFAFWFLRFPLVSHLQQPATRRAAQHGATRCVEQLRTRSLRIVVPYKTYSPDTAYAPAADYPYVPGYARPLRPEFNIFREKFLTPYRSYMSLLTLLAAQRFSAKILK